MKKRNVMKMIAALLMTAVGATGCGAQSTEQSKESTVQASEVASEPEKDSS